MRPRGYWGLPAFASLSMAGSVCMALGCAALGWLGLLAMLKEPETPNEPIRFEFVQEPGKVADKMPAETAPAKPTGQRWTAREIECLAQNLYHEARGEPEEGQVAVAYVVLNRVARRIRGSDVCSVIWAPKQFSWTAHPRQIQDRKSWQKAWQIAKAVLAGELPNPVGPADHYHADNVYPAWARKKKKVRKIGHHIFYF